MSCSKDSTLETEQVQIEETISTRAICQANLPPNVFISGPSPIAQEVEVTYCVENLNTSAQITWNRTGLMRFTPWNCIVIKQSNPAPHFFTLIADVVDGDLEFCVAKTIEVIQ